LVSAFNQSPDFRMIFNITHKYDNRMAR